MTRRGNPFRPSFGASPRVVVGRGDLLDEFDVALDEGPGSPMRSILVSGARGMGKTVVLNELEERARTRGWHVLRLPEGPGLLAELERTLLPARLAEHDPGAEQRRVTGAGIGPVGSVSTEISQTYPASQSVGSMLERLTEIAESHGTGVLLTLDEVQAAPIDDVARLASAYQHLLRDEREVAFVGAGLPVGIGTLLDQQGSTFLRRAERVDLTPLRHDEVRDAAVRTVREAGRVISPEGAERLSEIAHGYPYLLQLVGYQAWRAAGDDEVITATDVGTTLPLVVDRMSRLVHTPALRQVPQGQLDYLRAMAADDGPSSTGEVAARLGVSKQHGNVVRSRLIDRELIAPAGHGLVDVALPYLREHLRRG
ncbi:ATP-binding protein [Serinicoccus kebangsaanensis]|uniref:ATP-binding protein n=1 Tax=Serinicoccus kebangsaanensis TaxID=2602069 RepID=UPI00124F7225|nr:ATP-binding protein [Serinicoccus kebangsaanensis]